MRPCHHELAIWRPSEIDDASLVLPSWLPECPYCGLTKHLSNGVDDASTRSGYLGVEYAFCLGWNVDASTGQHDEGIKWKRADAPINGKDAVDDSAAR